MAAFVCTRKFLPKSANIRLIYIVISQDKIEPGTRTYGAPWHRTLSTLDRGWWSSALPQHRRDNGADRPPPARARGRACRRGPAVLMKREKEKEMADRARAGAGKLQPTGFAAKPAGRKPRRGPRARHVSPVDVPGPVTLRWGVGKANLCRGGRHDGTRSCQERGALKIRNNKGRAPDYIHELLFLFFCT